MEIISIDKECKNKVILRVEENGTGKICVAGGIYSINEMAVEIVRLLHEQNDILTVARQIDEEYDVSCAMLYDDIKDFLMRLRKIDVISEKMYMKYCKELSEHEQQKGFYHYK